MKWFCKRVFIVVTLVATFACGGSSTTTPTAPTGNASLETFTGGFDIAGSGPVHNFTISKSNGLLNIVLTSVVNTSTSAAAGVAVGLPWVRSRAAGAWRSAGRAPP